MEEKKEERECRERGGGREGRGSQENKRVLELMGWISVKDQMPKEDEWLYLGSSLFGTTTWGICMDGEFVNPDQNYLKIEGVTHWMPLPEPPKTGENEL